MNKTVLIETKLLNKELSVSELSDENCRNILRRILQRHRNNLIQLEAKYRQQEANIPKVEIINTSTNNLPTKK